MKAQFVYKRDELDPSQVVEEYRSEVLALTECGLSVSNHPLSTSSCMIFRGYSMWKASDYPNDGYYLQGWKEYEAASRMSIYLPLIQDLSFETIFVEQLNDSCIQLIEQRGWERAFIKNDIKSLWGDDEMSSVWPDNSMDALRTSFERKYPNTGRYAIRKYVDASSFYEEERYWVIFNGIYHRNKQIPDLIKKAVERLLPLNIQYYTIDAIPNFIVEINPGESSDRAGANSPALFASWWKDALLRAGYTID